MRSVTQSLTCELLHTVETSILAMVNNCCVCGCTNYVGKKPGLRFFRFPLSDKARCARWAAAVRRVGWEPKKYMRICGEHFVTGMI